MQPWRYVILISADRGGLISDYAERFLSARASGSRCKPLGRGGVPLAILPSTSGRIIRRGLLSCYRLRGQGRAFVNRDLMLEHDDLAARVPRQGLGPVPDCAAGSTIRRWEWMSRIRSTDARVYGSDGRVHVLLPIAVDLFRIVAMRERATC